MCDTISAFILNSCGEVLPFFCDVEPNPVYKYIIKNAFLKNEIKSSTHDDLTLFP